MRFQSNQETHGSCVHGQVIGHIMTRQSSGDFLLKFPFNLKKISKHYLCIPVQLYLTFFTNLVLIVLILLNNLEVVTKPTTLNLK